MAGGISGPIRRFNPRHRVDRLVNGKTFHLLIAQAPKVLPQDTAIAEGAGKCWFDSRRPAQIYPRVSGGQRQRIAIARRLIHQATTSDHSGRGGLGVGRIDPRADASGFLADLGEPLGRDLLFISHDLSVVPASDVPGVLVMQAGNDR